MAIEPSNHFPPSTHRISLMALFQINHPLPFFRCEQQSLSALHLPVTRLVPLIRVGVKEVLPMSNTLPAAKTYCLHLCEQIHGKRSRAWPRSPRQSCCSGDSSLLSEGNLSRILCPKSM